MWLFRISLFAVIVLSTWAHAADQPNILFCISDDQSYAHAGANGDRVVKTPAFDRIAREGIRFVHAFCDAPSCGPARSAILTGQPIWRLEEAGNIHSTLAKKFATYTEVRRASRISPRSVDSWGRSSHARKNARRNRAAGPLRPMPMGFPKARS